MKKKCVECDVRERRLVKEYILKKKITPDTIRKKSKKCIKQKIFSFRFASNEANTKHEICSQRKR